MEDARPEKKQRDRHRDKSKNAARARRRAARRTDSEYAATALARKHSVAAVEFLASVMAGDSQTVTVKVKGEDGEDASQEVQVWPDIPERVKAAKELLDRGMGRPVARKEVTHSINDEHLAALKKLADAVDKMPGREEPEGLIDITPADRDRDKLAYAEGRT